MTPREFVAALLGGIVALIFHALVDKPETCRRACCMPGRKIEGLNYWTKGFTSAVHARSPREVVESIRHLEEANELPRHAPNGDCLHPTKEMCGSLADFSWELPMGHIPADQNSKYYGQKHLPHIQECWCWPNYSERNERIAEIERIQRGPC